jgi:CheY-like chemotaxis protein
MVFGFLRQSNGHIDVYSEPGAGTTFRLYLPGEASAPRSPAPTERRPEVRGAGEMVLVVEDNPRVRRTVLRQLHELGYRSSECESAAAALAVLQRQRIDLLFTDIVMPGGLDGVGLAHLAGERWPTLKIVLTSGFPRDRLDTNGDPRLLSKPYSKQELASVPAERHRNAPRASPNAEARAPPGSAAIVGLPHAIMETFKCGLPSPRRIDPCVEVLRASSSRD